MAVKKINKRTLFLISIVISVGLTLFSYNKVLVNPFTNKFELHNVGDAYLDDDYSLIINEGGSELLFLKEKKLDKILIFDERSPIDKANQVIKSDDAFYVAGYNIDQNTDYIIKYSLDGKNNKTIFEFTRGANISSNPIQDMYLYDDKLYVVNTNDNYTVAVFEIDINSNTQKTILTNSVKGVINSQYLPQERSLLLTLFDGTCVKENIDDGIVTLRKETDCEFVYIHNDDVITYGGFKDNDLKVDGQLIAHNIITTNISHGGKYIGFDDEACATYYLYDIENDTVSALDSIKYSTTFWFENIQRIIPIVYLILAILHVVLEQILFIIKKNNVDYIKKVGLLFTVILAIFSISIFYTKELYENNKKYLCEDLKFGARYLASTINEEIFSDDINYFDRNNAVLYEEIDKYVDLCNEGNVRYSYAIYKYVDDDTIVVYNSLDVPIPGTFVSKDIAASSDEYPVNDEGVYQYDSSNMSNYYTYNFIYKDGELIGTIELGIDNDSFETELKNSVLTTTTKISVIAIVIYIVIIELKAYFAGSKLRKQYIKDKIPNDDLALIRPFSFLFNFAFNMDAAILILISQDLLATSNLNTDNNLLLTLPTIAKSLSALIGALIFSKLSRKFSYKRLFIVSEAIYALFEVLVVIAIFNNNYLLFSLFILIGNVANGVGYGVFASLPQREENEARQIAASEKLTLGDSSAGLLAGLLSGVVADSFGNSFVYMVSAVFIVCAILMGSIILPGRIKMVDSSKKSSAGLLGNIKFFSSPVMLSFILVYLLPKTMLDGYNSFLFPLYASEYGLSKTYISFINIIIKTLAVGLTSYFISLFEGVDYWRRDIIVSILCGIMFLGFIIDDSIVWCITALFFVTISTKIHESLRNTLWIRQAKVEGINPISLSGGYSTVLQLVETIKSPILSILLSFPNNIACFLLGGYVLASTGVFVVTTGKSPISKSNNKAIA
ncbi:MAG: MFS transporter [Erysipelotrichaceae bacterium]|nr:MFS transporter [Erysipelotrichaceae bacterium]